MKMTLLHWAALKSDNKIIMMLLAAKIDIDVINSKEKTTLYKTCFTDLINNVKHLIIFDVNINTSDQYDYRSIHFIVLYNIDIKFIFILLFNEAIINDARNIFNKTLLIKVIFFNNACSWKFLLENNANVNILNWKENISFFKAITRNAFNCFKLLLTWDVNHLHVKNER